jgi:hypothetical protein
LVTHWTRKVFVTDEITPLNCEDLRILWSRSDDHLQQVEAHSLPTWLRKEFVPSGSGFLWLASRALKPYPETWPCSSYEFSEIPWQENDRSTSLRQISRTDVAGTSSVKNASFTCFLYHLLLLPARQSSCCSSCVMSQLSVKILCALREVLGIAQEDKWFLEWRML